MKPVREGQYALRVNHEAFVSEPTISAPKEMHCLSFMSVGRVMLQLRLVSFKYNERKCHVVESIPWISKTEPIHWADSSDDVRNSKDVIVVAISSLLKVQGRSFEFKSTSSNRSFPETDNRV